ncbi:sulfurtransferase [Nannocystis pusilla]|uniref:sulfurtransferase n=1 Tax=Nannocystis pusilla TaxID=889268 RepID=UPI003BF5724B
MRAWSITWLCVAGGCRPEAVAEASRAPVGVVTVDALLRAPADPRRVVVDVRPAEAYAGGHIPGALHLDVKLLRAEVDGVPEQLAPRAAIEAAMAGLGVELGDEVVVVDERSSPPAARVVWTLRWFGHAADKVRMLDGGRAAWVAAGGTQTSEVPTVAAGEGPRLGEEQRRLGVDAAWIAARLQDPAVLLLDVRSDDEWKAGRIPGAWHVPWQSAVTEDGRLKELPTLRELYARALERETVVVYCKSGMRASLTWLVLQVLGHADARLYDGSWNEWGARPDLPKET